MVPFPLVKAAKKKKKKKVDNSLGDSFLHLALV
jgi:hypothetical protein